jgi:hypothetical protein
MIAASVTYIAILTHGNNIVLNIFTHWVIVAMLMDLVTGLLVFDLFLKIIKYK